MKILSLILILFVAHIDGLNRSHEKYFQYLFKEVKHPKKFTSGTDKDKILKEMEKLNFEFKDIANERKKSWTFTALFLEVF